MERVGDLIPHPRGSSTASGQPTDWAPGTESVLGSSVPNSTECWAMEIGVVVCWGLPKPTMEIPLAKYDLPVILFQISFQFHVPDYKLGICVRFCSFEDKPGSRG